MPSDQLEAAAPGDALALGSGGRNAMLSSRIRVGGSSSSQSIWSEAAGGATGLGNASAGVGGGAALNVVGEKNSVASSSSQPIPESSCGGSDLSSASTSVLSERLGSPPPEVGATPIGRVKVRAEPGA